MLLWPSMAAEYSAQTILMILTVSPIYKQMQILQFMLRKQLPEREDVAMLSSSVASCGALRHADRLLSAMAVASCV